MRNGSFNLGGGTVTYLHSDHLGSASAVSNASGAIINTATYDPWGQVVEGGVPQTDKGYTGQQRDDTGLMWYQSRLYDPNLGRFLSADSVVPGTASGSMDGVALKPLTVDFHETGFVSGLNGESNAPFWFQMSGQEKQQAGRPWGPSNPQSLNRYSYVLNNPMRYSDPTGHARHKQPQTPPNPREGEPDSKVTTYKPDGQPKQTRKYAPDGYPDYDIDHDHGHEHGPDGLPVGNDHEHKWGRPAGGGMPTDKDRGLAHPPGTFSGNAVSYAPEDVVVAVTIVSTIAIGGGMAMGGYGGGRVFANR